jgi:F-type H+-transporting ATPase subunit delta
MAKTASARRHAQAVFQIALEKDELDKWQADLETIAGALKDPQLAGLLGNPKLRFGEKAKMLRSILSSISPLALNLAYLLVAKNRLMILDGLVDEYKRSVNAYYGRETAEVTTAISLSNKEKKKLQGKLAAVTGKELVVTAHVDPGIMGGVVAKVGDKLIDSSVRTRLKELRRDLLEAGLEVK